MNGAERLVRTLVAEGVDVCFANPGTSEMHFVAALDQVGGIRCVLGLFEGVVTGAADGYARMAGKPGVTLLHTGPGLANGLANLHNAKKAHVAIVNIVGEHAEWHIAHDAPLTSDIEGLARPVSDWIRTTASAADLARDGSAAMAAARRTPGQIATLILPANTAWETVGGNVVGSGVSAADAQSDDKADDKADDESVDRTSNGANEGAGERADDGARTGNDRELAQVSRIADTLRDNDAVAIVLGGRALHEDALDHASRIAQATGATLLCETFKTRMQRGAGRVAVTAIPYRVQDATALLAPFRHIVTVGARAPVAFFAYPDTPSELYAPEAILHTLASVDEDIPAALSQLEHALEAGDRAPLRQELATPERVADGLLTPESLANVVARLLPNEAIVVDESITAGRGLFAATRSSAPHDWLEVCGGSIGGGFPLATGAAIACADRRVVCIEGDGSAMYTVQALWTQAREALDITTLVLANQSYEILKHELQNVQASSGTIALSMMDLDKPALDWVALATGMGVSASTVATVAELEEAFSKANATPGPTLIEVRL